MPSSQPASLNIAPGDWDELQRQLNFVFKDIYSLFDAVRGMNGNTSTVADVYGPASSIDSNIAEFDGTTGKKIKDGSLTHAGVYDAVLKKHTQQHSITATADHTSTATAGQMLKADANGLPVNATNTDTDVADAVLKKHVAATAGVGIVIAGQQVDVKQQTAEADVAAVSSIALNAGADQVDRAAFNTALGTLVTEINAIKTKMNNVLAKARLAEWLDT